MNGYPQVCLLYTSTILEGESRLDTSPVTGEPVPVSVGPGSEVISGSVSYTHLDVYKRQHITLPLKTVTPNRRHPQSALLSLTL